jgi:hypothetical protein
MMSNNPAKYISRTPTRNHMRPQFDVTRQSVRYQKRCDKNSEAKTPSATALRSKTQVQFNAGSPSDAKK